MSKTQVGRGFPRDVDFGFNQDSADHKREYMDQASGYNDFLIIVGPADVGWIVDPDFTISASRLTIQHARSAFVHYHKRRKTHYSAHYARRLGAKIRDIEGGREFRDEFVEICKLTKRNNVGGLDPKDQQMQGIINAHREALAYLGELAIQTMRAIENGISLRGFVEDIRKISPYDLKEILDRMQIPACNQPNPYADLAYLPSFHAALQSQWDRQDDPQVNEINQMLRDGSIVGRNH